MATKYEELVQEDLNVGVDMTWVMAPGRGQLRSTQIGMHTFARGQIAYETTWAPGAITASGYSTTDISVPNATVGDFVLASHDKILTNNLVIYGHVTATGSVRAVIYNPGTASVTPASGTLSVLVFPVRSAIVIDTIVEGTVTYDDGGGPAPVVGNTVELTDDLDTVQATTTTDAAGLYRFTNPTVTILDGQTFKIVAHAPPPGTGAGSVDTTDDSHTWASETTTVVDIAMNGA